MFRVESATGTKSPEVECADWLDTQDANAYAEYNSNNHCPSVWWQAELDFE